MLSKACFSLFLCFLEQSETAFADGKVKNVGLASVLDDKTSQHVDQTFNINNWGLGKIERKLLSDIKAKLDSLSDKGKMLYNSKLRSIS